MPRIREENPDKKRKADPSHDSINLFESEKDPIKRTIEDW
jgi:hypothetical protein